MAKVVILAVVLFVVAVATGVGYYFMFYKPAATDDKAAVTDDKVEAETTPKSTDKVEPAAIFGDGIPNVDFSGFDIECKDNIPDTYTTECKDLCKINEDCAAYVTLNDSKCCYKTKQALIEGEPSIKAESDKHTLYMKKSYVDEFVKTEGKDSEGGDIKQIVALKDNVPALEAACSALDDCMGFNTHGWLKSTIRAESEWRDDSGDLFIRQ